MNQYNNDFRCSSQAFADFLSGALWQDMLQELHNWEKRITEEVMNITFDPSTGQMAMSSSERVLYDEGLRGSYRAIQEMKLLPVTIMEIIQQNQELKNEREERKQGSDTRDNFDEFHIE